MRLIGRRLNIVLTAIFVGFALCLALAFVWTASQIVSLNARDRALAGTTEAAARSISRYRYRARHPPGA